MITSTTITTGDITVPDRAFTATDTGLFGGTGQQTAITTIALCNIEEPDAVDETVNTSSVNIHFVKNGSTANRRNLVVSNLIVPAGETVFFSDERIILDSNDSIWIGSTDGDVDTAGSFNVGSTYIIVTAGGTDFTLLGAADSNPGTVFTATGDGATNGTGTARKILIIATVSSLPV
jgi:hypothetical protein